MISSVFYSCIIFIFLLHGCFAAKRMYKPDDEPSIHEWRRALVVAIAEADLCRKGIWFYQDDTMTEAKKQCEEAFNAFVGLTYEEQEACPNAAAPKCRHLRQCDRLTFGCTFICDMKEGGWRQRSDGTNVWISWVKTQEIELYYIVKQMFKIQRSAPQMASGAEASSSRRRRISGNRR